ncbi:unnamed protein product [Peniophora sp. CBMAI 1063]|nr:unnamed protein product [Peniophora sp. CBMAI 1063]
MSAPAKIIQDERNPRGIPKALFISDVEEYLSSSGADAEKVLSAFQDAMAKYRYMDGNLNQRRRSLEDKVPDIKKTLSMVEYLRDRREGKKPASGDEDDLEDDLEDDAEPKPLVTTFELADTLYAEAELEDSDTVHLWLGANVMLSYTLQEAVELLTSKLATAQTSLDNTIEDLEFLREQLTIMEVNTARVYNWDVKRRRDLRERERLEAEKEKEK